jgi:2-keto-4-pentenoate hydratase/2-oxohepta-3-ene-1,7-dioic acid hydratase in catechol pathway
MRLMTYLRGDAAHLGALVEDRILNLGRIYEFLNTPGPEPPVFFQDMLSFLQNIEQSLPLAAELTNTVEKMTQGDLDRLAERGAIVQVDDISCLAPIMNPGKLICVGLNYPPPNGDNTLDVPDYPVLFHKVATSLVGHRGAVEYPRIARELVYEGELAFVIGSRGKHIDRGSAMSYVAGYTIANDIGSPDLQARSSQWTTGKMLDTFCPLGPYLVTRDEILEPNELHIRTTLNGEIVQAGNTSEMIFDIPYLVSYLSSLVTLEPGDVVLSGSPKRNGDQPDPRVLMQPGDNICVEIEGLGTLCNPIIPEVLN